MYPALAATLVVAILLLAVPVNLIMALDRDGAWRGRVVVVWLFGHVRMSMRPKRRTKRRRQLRKFNGRASKHRRMLSAMLRSEGFARRMMVLLRDLLRAFSHRRIRLQCVLGLPDPADTGRLMGVIAPVSAVAGKLSVGRHSDLSIKVMPDFSGPRFQGQCRASVRFVPLTLIGLVTGFLFSGPVWRAIRAALSERKAAV